jgi:hypothetical protein
MSYVDDDNADALFEEAIDNINNEIQKDDYVKTVLGLEQALDEIQGLKNMSQEYINIRNQLIKKLYTIHRVSAAQLGDMSGLTRQMVHLIVKEDNEV